jgi:hypothetical protein
VRLQVTLGGAVGWQIHEGDASYDNDHAGYWGAASVDARDSDADLEAKAKELIGQALDHFAQSI